MRKYGIIHTMCTRGVNLFMDRQNQSVKSTKPGNVRFRRMFQSDEPAHNAHIPEEIVEKDLDRIVLKFGSEKEESVSIIDSFNKFIELSNTTPIDSLFEYIEELKSLYYIDEPEEEDDREMDIAELIKRSEAELLQEQDQRSLLYDLIRDVSHGEPQKSEESDEQFLQNIEAMLGEENEDVPEPSFEEPLTDGVKDEAIDLEGSRAFEDHIDPQDDEDVVLIEKVEAKADSVYKKKRELSPREKLLLVFMLICCVLLYIVYQEQFHSIFMKLIDIIKKMF